MKTIKTEPKPIDDAVKVVINPKFTKNLAKIYKCEIKKPEIDLGIEIALSMFRNFLKDYNPVKLGQVKKPPEYLFTLIMLHSSNFAVILYDKLNKLKVEDQENLKPFVTTPAVHEFVFHLLTVFFVHKGIINKTPPKPKIILPGNPNIIH